MLGMLVVSILSMVIFFWVLFSGLDSMFESKPYKVKKNTVLHIQLENGLTDKTNGPDFGFGGMSDMGVGLIDLIDGLDQAKEDDKIEGVFLDLTDVNTGLASIQELRAALEDFKSSGKWIVAYGQGEYFSEKALYLASVANEVYLFPTLVMEWNGIGVERMFYKETLDKLGVKIQIIRGSNNDFKSAVEPFFLTEMSDSARHQTQVLVDNMWANMVANVSTARDIPADSLNKYAEKMTIRTAHDAADLGFVDGLKYPDEVYGIIMSKVGVDELEDVHFLDVNKYVFETLIKEDDEKEKKGDRIAVIMAEGGVNTGKGKEVHSTTIAKHIRDARLDDDVKGILLRVNSPGGSALASDIIWREVILTKKVKPVYVSMGDVAASGGYYISCAADKIYASEGTITGSIGVFGMIPYTGDMMKDKLGVTSDFVTTHPHSVLSLNKKLSEEEFGIVQEEVDRIYDEFLTRVDDGREKLSKEEVNRIGRGRVWSGTDALRIGLVDELGTYQKARKDLLAKLELDDDAVEYFPKRKYPPLLKLKEMFSAFGGGDEDEDDEEQIQTKSWENSAIYKAYAILIQDIQSLDLTPGVKAQLPYTIQIR
ncbi:MAG: signal peptide peptidase SppA [Crocinitomicaceae bacterium]|nr:signal peptide peptidase SppA [Crocinitomicaceae bacterium]